MLRKFEMRTLFADCPETISLTQDVADRCEFEFESGYFVPSFPRPAEFANDDDLLRALTERGLEGRGLLRRRHHAVQIEIHPPQEFRIVGWLKGQLVQVASQRAGTKQALQTFMDACQRDVSGTVRLKIRRTSFGRALVARSQSPEGRSMSTSRTAPPSPRTARTRPHPRAGG